MKPYLLMLLLAIPPLICNLLTCENAEKPDTTPAAEKSAVLPARVVPAAVTPPPAPATSVQNAAPAKPVPSRTAPPSVKAWYMM